MTHVTNVTNWSEESSPTPRADASTASERLDGRVCLVTGAARGIGRAIAGAFDQAGATVVLADIDGAECESAADKLKSGCAITLDVSDSVAVHAAVETVITRFGRLDVLVNNAGIDDTGAITEITDSQWERMVAVNLSGVFYCTRAVVPQMISQRYGRIISVGSNLGIIGSVGMPHYCAVKAGVHGFMRAIARELAPHSITANTIAPGAIQTELLDSLPSDLVARKLAEIPLGRFGKPEEIAPAAVLLASDAGAYFTGSVVNVSGGDVMV